MPPGTRQETRRIRSKNKYKRSKIDFLHRHIIDYQDLFKSLATLSKGDAYLFLDDLYHIRRTDQCRWWTIFTVSRRTIIFG